MRFEVKVTAPKKTRVSPIGSIKVESMPACAQWEAHAKSRSGNVAKKSR